MSSKKKPTKRARKRKGDPTPAEMAKRWKGRLSEARRKKILALGVPEAVVDDIEKGVTALLMDLFGPGKKGQ